MLEFIICDDDSFFLSKVETILDKIMFKKNINYKISKFYDYDKYFMDYISKNENICIYILDIETPSNSGIIIGIKIRNHDLISPIIFLTGHEELGSLLLRKDLMFLAFINKFEDFNIRLKNSIEKALLLTNNKVYLKIKMRNSILRIKYENILYITKESIERKTIIKTDNNEYKVNISIQQIKQMLDNSFIQTHRSCIVNQERVEEYNYKDKYILFDNNKKIDLISSKYRME